MRSVAPPFVKGMIFLWCPGGVLGGLYDFQRQSQFFWRLGGTSFGGQRHYDGHTPGWNEVDSGFDLRGLHLVQPLAGDKDTMKWMNVCRQGPTRHVPVPLEEPSETRVRTLPGTTRVRTLPCTTLLCMRESLS